MVPSVPVTCHVTAVMGLSMAAQTTGSQEPVSCDSRGRRFMRGKGLMIGGEFKGHDGERRGQKVSLQVHAASRRLRALPGQPQAADSRWIGGFLRDVFRCGCSAGEKMFVGRQRKRDGLWL